MGSANALNVQVISKLQAIRPLRDRLNEGFLL